MMRLVRAFLLIGAGLLGAAPAMAGTTVVHVAAFSCGHCADMEPVVPRLRADLEAGGVGYSFAPIALSSETVFAPELFYFAARETVPGVADAVRAKLFEAMHGSGLPLETLPQVTEWFLLQDPGRAATWHTVSAATDLETPRRAVVKAYRLVERAGVTAVPAFIVVADGRIVHTVQKQNGESSDELRARVVDSVRTLENRP